MNKYGLHGKLTAKAGRGDALSDILLKASTLVAQAQGCHLYLVSRDPEDPDSVWVTEVWDSQEDHDRSLMIPEVKSLIVQAMPILAGKPDQGQELQVLGGAGLV